MSNILNTRKTVKHYIWYNLTMIFVSFMLVFSFSLMYDPSIIKMTDYVTKNMNENSFYIFVTLLFILFGSHKKFWQALLELRQCIAS